MKIHKFLEKNSNANATAATINLFKALRVPVTNTSIIETLERHPDYPSLLSVSDTLKSWNVRNVAMKISPEDIGDIPTPFIAHTRKRTFVVVKSTQNGLLTVDDNGKTTAISPIEFNRDWDNVVLMAFPDGKSGDEMFTSRKKFELLNQVRFPLILIASVALILCCISASAFSLPYMALLVLKFAGSIISSLLLWFDIDKNNPNLRKICSSQRRVNCSAVLSSKGAKLFNFISWSEIGFFYFTGSTIFLLISASGVHNALAFLSVLNFIALPYTVYSVFYQWKIAKQWCKLCLFVQGILLLEFLVCYLSFWQSSEALAITYVSILSAAIAFLLPVFFWITSKPAFLKAVEMKEIVKDLSGIKSNPETFIALLEKGRRIDMAEGIGIVIGNPDAKNTLLKVCNPFCGPCRKAHSKIDKLVTQNEDIKVRIVFSGTKEDHADKTNLIVDKLISIYQNDSPSLLLRALDDWYVKSLPIEQFLEQYKDFKSTEHTLESMSKMKAWCFNTGIEYTPTYFFNSYQLPDVYNVEEIKNFL